MRCARFGGRPVRFRIYTRRCLPVHSWLVLVCAALASYFAMAQFDVRVRGQEQSTSQEPAASAGIVQANQQWWKAAQAGDVVVLNTLLEAGTDVDTETQYGATALMYAASRQHAAAVELLLEQGADPNHKDRFYGATAMSWAAMKPDVSIAVMLVEAGSQDVTGALRIAIRAKDSKATKQIILKGKPSTNQLIALRGQLPSDAPEELTELFSELPPAPVAGDAIARPAWKPTAAQLEVYTGTYQLPNQAEQTEGPDLPFLNSNGNIIVKIVDGQLQTEQGMQLVPQTRGVFQFGDTHFHFQVVDDRAAELRIAAETEFVFVRAKRNTRFQPSSPDSLAADRQISSSDWPQFRGTGARGVAEGQGPPIHWDVPEQENVLWSQPIPGLAHSCPVIVGDRLFLTSAVSSGEDQALRTGLYGDVDSVEERDEHSFEVYCLDKTTGEILWHRVACQRVPAVKRHLKSTHANATPACNGEYVVAFFGSEGLYCYTVDGELVWKRDFGVLDSGWFFDSSFQWEFASSPIIFRDMVIVQCDIQEGSFVAALNLADGTEVWRQARDEIPSWATPTVVETDSGPQLITNATRFARSYDPTNGDELWRIGNNSEIVVPTPFAAHGLIFVASGYRPIKPIHAIDPRARGDLTDGASTNSEYVVWNAKNSGPYMVTPVCYGDFLYTCNSRGIFECLQATTGDRVYRERVSGKNARSFVGSLLAADGHVYVPSEEGVVLVVQAGPDFSVVAENPLGESLLSTPAISEGVIYLRGERNLVAIRDKGTD